MSGIAKGIKKVFKKVRESKLLKTIAIAAAIWFTVGTAQAYFAGPTQGMFAESMSASASNMWTTTSEFFAADSVATGTTSIESELAQEGLSSGASLSSSGGEVLAPGVADTTAGVAEGVNASAVQTGADGLTTAASSTGAVPYSGLAAASPAAAAAAPTGMMGWLQANPMATMMLGQAGAGAYGGYLEDKQAEREQEERANRGLMGFDSTGNYGGVVKSQMQPAEPTVTPTGAAPQAVASPQVAQQQPAGGNVPVPRSNLPKLNQQGQLLQG